MFPPDPMCFSLNILFKDLRKKVCEACLFFGNLFQTFLNMSLNTGVVSTESVIFIRQETYFSHIHPG